MQVLSTSGDSTGGGTASCEEELSVGDSAGNYEIRRTLAAGGCGFVYEAEHRVLKRRGAVKVLRHEMTENPAMLRRFVREAQAVNVIKHPNIVDIFEFGTLNDGRPFFVMEYLEGDDLAAILARSGPMAADQALQYLAPICDALRTAHAVGIVHRDLKGSNMFVVRDTGEVKLLDFGVAKLLRPDSGASSISAVGTTLGTPYTMAPEQVRGADVDQRTDVYALGAVLFELLTGRYPFEAEDPQATQIAHLTIPCPRPSKYAPVSKLVDAVVLRCMEKSPEDRYQSVTELLDALREAVTMCADADAPNVRSRALAVCVSAAADDGEPSDDVLDALETMESQLLDAGLAIVVSTSDTLIGAIALPDENVVSEILAPITAEAEAHADLSVGVHVADAERNPAGAFVGGPLLDLGSWTRRRPGRRLWCTREAAVVLPELEDGEA